MIKITSRRALASTAALAAVVPLAGAVGSPATAATSSAKKLDRRVCSPPKYPSRTGRSERLVTFHLSCADGRSISLAHYRCRIKGGKKGYCKAKTVRGYKCVEQRLQNVRVPYYEGRVECTRGQRVSVFIYRQNNK